MLNDKQIRFCEEYIVDLNGTQAAIRAGYSERTADVQASRLLVNVKIQAKIQELKEKRSKRTEITADMVVREMALIGFSNIADYLEIDEQEVNLGDEEIPIIVKQSSVKVFKTSDVGRRKMRAVAEIKQTKDGISLKMHDKVKALEDLGRHTGAFEKDNEQKGTVVVPFTDDQVTKIIQSLRENKTA